MEIGKQQPAKIVTPIEEPVPQRERVAPARTPATAPTRTPAKTPAPVKEPAKAEVLAAKLESTFAIEAVA